MTQEQIAAAKHEPVEAKRFGHGHYSYKNWSYDFACPACERTGRFNLNFLGGRRVMCDGEKFTKVKK